MTSEHQKAKTSGGRNNVKCPYCADTATAMTTVRAKELLEGHINRYHPGRPVPNTQRITFRED